MIGNYPQAFSHIGLINGAWAIAQARQRTAAGTHWRWPDPARHPGIGADQ